MLKKERIKKKNKNIVTSNFEKTDTNFKNTSISINLSDNLVQSFIAIKNI